MFGASPEPKCVPCLLLPRARAVSTASYYAVLISNSREMAGDTTMPSVKTDDLRSKVMLFISLTADLKEQSAQTRKQNKELKLLKQHLLDFMKSSNTEVIDVPTMNKKIMVKQKFSHKSITTKSIREAVDDVMGEGKSDEFIQHLRGDKQESSYLVVKAND